jgi:hypothetical protein
MLEALPTLVLTQKKDPTVCLRIFTRISNNETLSIRRTCVGFQESQQTHKEFRHGISNGANLLKINSQLKNRRALSIPHWTRIASHRVGLVHF